MRWDDQHQPSLCYNTIWENWENLIEWKSVYLRNKIKRSSKTRTQRQLQFCIWVEKAKLQWLILKSSGHCFHAFTFPGHHSDITTKTSQKPRQGNVSSRSLYHLHYISDQWAHHRDVITLLRPHSLYMSQRFCFWKTCLYIAFNSHGRHQMFDEEKCLRLSNLFSWPIPIARRRACCFSLGTYQNTETMTAFMSLTSIFNCLAINPRWE